MHFTCLNHPFLKNNFRLLIAHGKFETARKVCDKIAYWNGSHLTEKTWRKMLGEMDLQRVSANARYTVAFKLSLHERYFRPIYYSKFRQRV